MMKVLIALMLCCSYLVRDGLAAQAQWEESIHHVDLSHQHADQSSTEHEAEHHHHDCGLSTHGFIISAQVWDYHCDSCLRDSLFLPPEDHFAAHQQAPPFRPPIA